MKHKTLSALGRASPAKEKKKEQIDEAARG